LRRLRRFVKPGVFADQHAKSHATGFKDQRRQTRIAAGHKVAPFVEDLVVGQLALAVGANNTSPCQHRGGIEALLHRQGLGPNIAALTKLMRMPHHHVQARTIGQFRRQVRQCLGAALHEGRAQEQVFRRVAGQGQFGGQHHRGALGMRLARGGRYKARVAGQVADGGVDLRECHFHDVGR
jgi:hypothetical protein